MIATYLMFIVPLSQFTIPIKPIFSFLNGAYLIGSLCPRRPKRNMFNLVVINVGSVVYFVVYLPNIYLVVGNKYLLFRVYLPNSLTRAKFSTITDLLHSLGLCATGTSVINFFCWPRKYQITFYLSPQAGRHASDERHLWL